MFESILNSSSGSFSIMNELICMVAAVVLGSIVALVHTVDNRYSKNFLIAFIVFPLLVQVVIAMINGNVGAALAIGGAFSLIRFRSLQGNSRELVSVFFAMAIGLSLGVGQVIFASIFTVIGAIVLFAITKLNVGNNESIRRLKIVIPEDMNYDEMFKEEFDKYTKKNDLVVCKTTNMGSLYELEYEVSLKDTSKVKDFLDDIRIKNGNLKVSLTNPVVGDNIL